MNVAELKHADWKKYIRKSDGTGIGKLFFDFLIKHHFLLVSFTVSAAVFVAIYGVSVLSVTYTDWLMTSGDISQNYLGWRFFRSSEWKFPIGMLNQITYPSEVSIYLTDSVPLLAVFFKLFREILPEQFQYFGIWGLVCFLLQGLFAAKLIHHYVKSELVSILGSLFFLIAPVFLYRMFSAPSLASHWLILAALYLGIQGKSMGTRKKLLLWTTMGVLSASIHLYFVPMCFLILLAFTIQELVRDKKTAVFFGIPAVYLAGSVVTVWLLGGFASTAETVSDSLGQYSFNLNGLINPQGWSILMETLPSYGYDAGEGLAFAGIGVLLMLAAADIIWILRMVLNLVMKRKGIEADATAAGRRLFLSGNILAYLLIICLSLLLALSHQLTFGNQVIWSIPYPQVLLNLWNRICQSGRFIWPAVYLLTLGSTVFLTKMAGNRYVAAGLLILFCFFQVRDCKWQFQQRRVQFGTVAQDSTYLLDRKWKEWSERGTFRHIVFVSDITGNQELFYDICDYAADNRMTLSNFNFAETCNIEEIAKELTANLTEPQKDTLYIFSEANEAQCVDIRLDFYHINGLIVGEVNDVDLEELLILQSP